MTSIKHHAYSLLELDKQRKNFIANMKEMYGLGITTERILCIPCLVNSGIT